MNMFNLQHGSKDKNFHHNSIGSIWCTDFWICDIYGNL